MLLECFPLTLIPMVSVSAVKHSPLSSQNRKPTSSLLPTDLPLSFFCFHQTHDYYACGFAVCVCVCVCVCVHVGVGGVCVCACMCVACVCIEINALIFCKRPGLS